MGEGAESLQDMSDMAESRSVRKGKHPLQDTDFEEHSKQEAEDEERN